MTSLMRSLAVGMLLAVPIAQAWAEPLAGSKERRPRERLVAPRAQKPPAAFGAPVEPRRQRGGYDDPRFERGM